jgi:hypothetical protein
MAQAMAAELREHDHPWPGTYELCGPKINGNPEGYTEHRLIRHADAEVVDLGDVAGSANPCLMLRHALLNLGSQGWESIVWHHPDGRMAKLKVRDFA